MLNLGILELVAPATAESKGIGQVGLWSVCLFLLVGTFPETENNKPCLYHLTLKLLEFTLQRVTFKYNSEAAHQQTDINRYNRTKTLI